jgi:uracil-DNA glycosylase family 4
VSAIRPKRQGEGVASGAARKAPTEDVRFLGPPEMLLVPPQSSGVDHEAPRPRYAGTVLFVDRCRDCPYDYKAIGSRGNPAGRIVLVDEAPGATEVVEGSAAQRASWTSAVGGACRARSRGADFAITNAVACRAPRGRPSANAIDPSHGRLVHDLESHLRAVIVALGGTAAGAVTGQRGLEGLEYGMLVADLKPARRVPFGPGLRGYPAPGSSSTSGREQRDG